LLNDLRFLSQLFEGILGRHQPTLNGFGHHQTMNCFRQNEAGRPAVASRKISSPS
jgi:hypothetical protein